MPVLVLSLFVNENSAEIDLNKFTPITYDPVQHGYYRLGERVGNAFKDGAQLK